MATGKNQRKVRVAFHKNRENRARLQNLTRRAAESTESLDQMQSDERLSGKGRLSRYRTIIADSSSSSSENVFIDVDGKTCFPGRVLSAIGANNCCVEGPDGQSLNCSIRRVVRSLSREARNAVVAGDEVLYSMAENATGVIERVEPRRSTLSRSSDGYAHVIAANIDQTVIVASVADPPLKPALIDRFLCSAQAGGVRPVICLNKVDLVDPVSFQPVAGQYAQLGYAVIPTSVITGEGIAALRGLLIGQSSVFTGQSGVGKSSLLNVLDPGLARPTGEVSDESRKGKHTTRVTELQRLTDGGWVVDTPGIRQLQLWDILSEEVEGYFREFAPFVARCRFSNCSHQHETGCGVREAVRWHMISPLRYQSYLRIVNPDAGD